MQDSQRWQSVLSILLFAIYLDNLPGINSVVRRSVVLYADDVLLIEQNRIRTERTELESSFLKELNRTRTLSSRQASRQWHCGLFSGLAYWATETDRPLLEAEPHNNWLVIIHYYCYYYYYWYYYYRRQLFQRTVVVLFEIIIKIQKCLEKTFSEYRMIA